MRNLFTCLAIIFASLLLIIFFPVGDNPGNNSIYLTSDKRADIYSDIGVGETEPFRNERVRESIFASNNTILGGTIDNGGYYLPYAKIVDGNVHLTQLSYYVQTRGPWANVRINHSSTSATYKNAACGYTSMAMVISSITNDNSFTPLSLNPIIGSSGNNICTGGVYNWGGLQYYFARTGLNNSWKKTYEGETITAEKIRSTIDNGGFMVISTGAGSPYTTGGHMIILCGYTTDDAGNFKEMIIQDPNVTGNISSGRFANAGSRIRVDTNDWRIYDNILSTVGSVRYSDMRIATAHVPK